MTDQSSIIDTRRYELAYWSEELDWVEAQAANAPKACKAELARKLAQLRQLRDEAEEIFSQLADASADEVAELSEQFDIVWASFCSPLKFFKAEIAQLIPLVHVAEKLNGRSKEEPAPQPEARTGALQCPKCDSVMERVIFGGVVVDRCQVCRGLWFDLLEHEQLRTLAGSESIDDGKHEVGQRLNQMEEIKCPVCRTQMIAMVDARQPHIWYESCTVCYGVFFDAGEFTDFKEKTVLDYFRGWMTEERP